MNAAEWPALDYGQWRETGTALHLWTQIVGKYRLANTSWVNHSWHATLYVTPRGLTTGPVPDKGGTTRLSFDFCEHRLLAEGERCRSETFPLEPMSVSEFLHRTIELIERLGGNARIHGSPNEVAVAIPFTEDTQHRPYDRDAVERFHQALLRVESVFQQFRTGYLGKVSPVHLFWGSLDLAVTRFSGRPAPLHPGGIPNLPDTVTREAYSHEVSSAGFWAGGGGVDEALFYSYAYPEPAGFARHPIHPDGAGYDTGLHEYLLPYEQVRCAADPEGTLLQFLQSTYLAAADCGGWDRAALECDPGRVRVPRIVS